MGYSHYCYIPIHVSPEAWAFFVEKAKIILAAHANLITGWSGKSDVPVECSEDRIAFNGLEAKEEGCETCEIRRTKKPVSRKSCYSFYACKTRDLPYDKVVREMFLLAANCLGGYVSSDGGKKVYHEINAELNDLVNLDLAIPMDI